MTSWFGKKVAVWAMTPSGAELALRIRDNWDGGDIFVSSSLGLEREGVKPFTSFSAKVQAVFNDYDGHCFIMATGIVVRVIANMLKNKTLDPAVIVGDEAGKYMISLVSGHLGGANDLANELAGSIGAQPVITTSTDINQVPAIDVIAKEQGLTIENPQAIKHVSMALIKGETISLHDPYNLVKKHIPDKYVQDNNGILSNGPGVTVDYVRRNTSNKVLVLRPRCLVAGMGCRRGTPKEDLDSFIRSVFQEQGLSIHSLAMIVSVDLKAKEPGLLSLVADLGVGAKFFSTDQLDQVKKVPNPSPLVEKHIGVKSVCEAAAILATTNRNLIVPKQLSMNATLAIATMPFI